MGESDTSSAEQTEAAEEPASAQAPDDAAASSPASGATTDEAPSAECANGAEADARARAEPEAAGAEEPAEPVIEEEPFDPEEVADEADAESPEDAGDDAGEPAEPSEPSPEEQIAEARAAAARSREQMLRVAADYDNFRKRSARDLEDVRRRARQGTVRDFLPVFDNLERATAHTDSSEETAAIAEGIRMVLKQFFDTLKKLGVERIDAEGEAFDPTVHESIQLLESAAHAPGTVMSVAQPGYRMGDELIRPALVAVCKGPPAPPPEDPEDVAVAAGPAGDGDGDGPTPVTADDDGDSPGETAVIDEDNSEDKGASES